MVAGTQYAFSFTINNPSSAQVAASAVIEACGTASFAQAALVAPNSPLLGVANGSNPLVVVVYKACRCSYVYRCSYRFSCESSHLTPCTHTYT